MEKFFSRIFLVLWCSVIIFACAKKSTLELNLTLKRGENSKSVYFNTDKTGEVILHLTMQSDTEWATKDKESAVLTLFLDKDTTEQNQDIVLFMGKQPFTYRVLLGNLKKGRHSLRFQFNGEKSSPGASTIHVQQMNWKVISKDDPDYLVYHYSPVLYGRDDNNYTDTPLLMYHEIKSHNSKQMLEYTVIWSNEDGGTDSPSLMSRWGRTTDIELIYRAILGENSQILDEFYHGEGHDTLRFHGARIAGHPVLRTSTLNNLVSDSGKTQLKFFLSPELKKMKPHSREIFMDQFPWTYKVMAQEMHREGKYEIPGNPDTPAVSDARNYLYFEFNSTMEGEELALIFAVQLKGSTSWFYSNHKSKDVQSVNRGGWRRTTIELPPGTKLENLGKLKIFARGEQPFNIKLLTVSKIFILDENYIPQELPLNWPGEINLNGKKPEITFNIEEINES